MIHVLKNKSGYRLTVPTSAGRLYIANGQQVHSDFALPLQKATINCRNGYKLQPEYSYDPETNTALIIVKAIAD